MIPYLATNATRLEVSSAKLTQLDTLYGDIATPNTCMYFWNLWADEANGRTRVVTANLKIFEQLLKGLLSLIFDDIPVEKWTENDRQMFRRKVGAYAPHTRPTQPIPFECLALAKAKGSGEVRIGCKYLEEQSRYSRPKGSDGIEIAYSVVPVNYKAGAETSAKVKQMLVTPEDAAVRKVVPTALFSLFFDLVQTGCEVQFFVRWINTRYAKLSGKWAGPFSVIIA